MARKRKHHKNKDLAQQPTTTPPRINLKAELEEEMQRFEDEVRRNWHGGRFRRVGFVSLDFIADLFNTIDPPKLRLSIEADAERLKREGSEWQLKGIKIEKLEDYVRTQAPKLYAVLQLVGQSQLIVPLFNSDHLVTDRIFEQGEYKNDVPYCSRDYLQHNQYLRDFAEDIFEKQWCIPPILHQEFDPRFPFEWFRFPFIEEPKSIGQGGYGQVSKVKIAPGHLDLTAIVGYDKGSVVACKEVVKGHLTEEKVMREVSTIRARPHRNIVKFFASFSAGRENPWSEGEDVECLHILFEHADAENMQDWLTRRSTPEPLADVAERRKHILESIESIVEAVTYIHKKVGSEIAFHHDLKPGNILRFEGPPAVWKICDFGMANLKHHEETSGTTQGPTNRFGSYDYQPPEYFDDDSQPHGRPFDVWSLGCIILELLTLWKFGWSDVGIRRFHALRGENNALTSTNRLRPHQSKTSDHSFHNNRNVVNDWISHLRQGEEADVTFCYLLDLVSQMLKNRAQRIFVWEVHMDLHEMAHPDHTKQQLKNYFRGIVQDSETALNDLNHENNPLKTAIRMNKDWKVEVLRAKKWSVDKPQPTENLNMKRHDAGKYFTTLKTCPHTNVFERNKLYGRHDMDAKIAKGFSVSNFVGLYGLSGIGKSHLAYHYVVRFKDPQSKEDRRHTFWIEAGTETRLQETVGNIAEEIALKVSAAEELFPATKQWLSNAVNGPWIMVIDGLDKHAVAVKLEYLLPRDSGQILVTTKDRAILTNSLGNFLPDKRKEACLGVEHLALSESRQMFQWHNDDVSLDDSDMNDLLKSLSSPALIKLLAKYAYNTSTRTADLYKVMNTARKDGKPMQFPPAMYEDLTKTYLIFEPLGHRRPNLATSGRLVSKWPSSVFKLLGELSCMSKDEIDLELIRQVYIDRFNLLQMLGSLENCSFIMKGRSSDNTVRYCMHETVQDLVRRWVIDNMGLRFLLELYQSTLLMLAFLYRERAKSEADFEKIRRSSYLWKLPYMRHFERFLSLAREYSCVKRFDFECTDDMVRSVVMFARVYLDEGRYDDAVCVLDFTRKLYKGSQYRTQLIRTLSKAYTVPPLASRNKSSWLKATTLLEDVLEQCLNQSERDREQEWRCVIDLTNLYSKVSQTDKAWAALERLNEFKLVLKRGKPTISAQDRDSIKVKKEDVGKLAILKCISQARIHVAEAESSTPDSTTTGKYLRNAKNDFALAKSAIHEWFPKEDKWASELDEEVAIMLCKMNTPESTKEALDIYEKLLKRLQSEFATRDRSWSRTKEWGLKCRVAQVHLRLKRPNSSQAAVQACEQAFETLRRALHFYEKVYPKRNGKHNEHTRNCAHLLHEAYEKFGHTAEAEKIKAQFALHSTVCTPPPDIIIEKGLPVKKMVALSLLLAAAVFIYIYINTSRSNLEWRG